MTEFVAMCEGKEEGGRREGGGRGVSEREMQVHMCAITRYPHHVNFVVLIM